MRAGGLREADGTRPSSFQEEGRCQALASLPAALQETGGRKSEWSRHAFRGDCARPMPEFSRREAISSRRCEVPGDVTYARSVLSPASSVRKTWTLPLLTTAQWGHGQPAGRIGLCNNCSEAAVRPPLAVVRFCTYSDRQKLQIDCLQQSSCTRGGSETAKSQREVR